MDSMSRIRNAVMSDNNRAANVKLRGSGAAVRTYSGHRRRSTSMVGDSVDGNIKNIRPQTYTAGGSEHSTAATSSTEVWQKSARRYNDTQQQRPLGIATSMTLPYAYRVSGGGGGGGGSMPKGVASAHNNHSSFMEKIQSERPTRNRLGTSTSGSALTRDSKLWSSFVGQPFSQRAQRSDGGGLSGGNTLPHRYAAGNDVSYAVNSNSAPFSRINSNSSLLSTDSGYLDRRMNYIILFGYLLGLIISTLIVCVCFYFNWLKCQVVRMRRYMLGNCTCLEFFNYMDNRRFSIKTKMLLTPLVLVCALLYTIVNVLLFGGNVLLKEVPRVIIDVLQRVNGVP